VQPGAEGKRKTACHRLVICARCINLQNSCVHVGDFQMGNVKTVILVVTLALSIAIQHKRGHAADLVEAPAQSAQATGHSA